jgi:predicted phage terminase large subunit-like protein
MEYDRRRRLLRDRRGRCNHRPGASVLIVDDALHDALSESEAETAWRWYSEVAVPRLEPGGATIMIGARFSEQDLCGRILASDDGPNWHVVNLPALAEGADDPLGRKPGEALWPERFSVEELAERRVRMGSRAFGAQFQQDPVPATGGMFQASWFRRRYGILPINLTRIQAVDGAWKTGVSNDYSCLATWATDGVEFFLLDVWRRKVEFHDLKRRVVEEYDRHDPSAVFVEAAASGLALISELRRTTGIPIIARTPLGSKEARAERVTPLFEAGKVLLPQSAPWLDEWIKEHLRFGAGATHDDQVDTTSLALHELRNLVLSRIRAETRPRFGHLFAQ